MADKGWHGDTPGHKKAAIKGSREAQLKNTLRAPVVLIKYIPVLYRGDKTFTPFESLDRVSDFDSRRTESLSAFANTPGIYFSTSRDNALGYGKFLTVVEVKPNANILKTNQPVSRAVVSGVLRFNPRLDIATADFSENKLTGYKMLVDAIMEEEDPLERLKAIWGDGQFTNSDFVEAMKRNGIDGLEVQKEGYKHYVIYNKDILTEVKV